ncbi:MAG: WbqC family protein [Deltaproteobacteria bacterium]|nr:WbqC family protein [Deltaproteobacteria bacterium]
MTKKIAIIQSNYIPWKGYFDIINMVDEFILLDDVKYTKNDWRNRNRIKAINGPLWLTIPIQQHSGQLIKEAIIQSHNWNMKHWKSICQHYSHARYFKEYRDFFEDLYLTRREKFLSEVNYRFLKELSSILKIDTTFRFSDEFTLVKGKNERLIDICKHCGANCYLSGPSAQQYIDDHLFRQEGIEVEFADYSAYPEYAQLYQPFIHDVSVIDLILNEGPNAPRYMKSFNKKN